MQKTALITGVTGQDGAYLSEFLLKKGYTVHGIKRRSSSFNTQRIDHLYQDPHVDHRNFILHYGDLTDASNLIRIIQQVQPDEIYNLGAQSHVQVSFETPEYTANVDALGTLRLLEAVRLLGLTEKTRVYQASTSELYGLVQEIPQTERTPFYPRSPYGVAKLYGYWITVNYREAYNMFACNGILFNHETIAAFTPMIFKHGEDGAIDIKPVSEIVKHHTNAGKVSIDENIMAYQETDVSEGLYVWDHQGWTKVLFASAYPHDSQNDNKQPRYIISKNSAVLATGDHECIMQDGTEKNFREIEKGDRVNLLEFPINPATGNSVSKEVAQLLGFIAGDGYFKGHKLQLTSKDKDKLKEYELIWLSLDSSNTVHYWETKSGFDPNKKVWQLRLNNATKWIKQFEIYDEYRQKRVPKKILNAASEIQEAFLAGYQHADGLKANSSRYEFRNFKTNSATLAAGLIYLLQQTTRQEYNINVEVANRWGKKRLYYSINVLSNSSLGQNHRNSAEKGALVLELEEAGAGQRAMHRQTGISRTFIRKIQRGYVPTDAHHLMKEKDEVKKIIEMPDYQGWFYDLTTESGTFHCGIGQGHVHNSPMRGETFVTRKITRAVARIAHGLQQKLYLGNLDARRDWGHAKDFVEAMWLMLQQDKPEDFVIATGQTTSVREFTKLAFREIGVELAFHGNDEQELGIVVDSWHPDFPIERGRTVVAVDPEYYRPTEVDLLIGDPSKALKQLGWKPKYNVNTLVEEMVASDMVVVKKEEILRNSGYEFLEDE